MKINKLNTIILLVIAAFLTSCSGKTESTEKKLNKNIAAIESLAEKSENLKNAEEAFQILREFNVKMKDVKGNVISLESKYLKASGEEKAEIEKTFNNANQRIEKATSTIYASVEPYRSDENVKQMLKKIQTVLITQ